MSEQRGMTQKDLGELLVKMGKRLLADDSTQSERVKAAASWEYLELSYNPGQNMLVMHDMVLAVTTFLKVGGPGDSNPIAGRDLAIQLGADVRGEELHELWWQDTKNE